MRQFPRRLMTAVAVPGIAVLTLTGCRDAAKVQPVAPVSSTPAPPVRSGPSGSPVVPAKTKLTVTVRASKTSKPKTSTLTCDPVGGDLAGREAACSVLAKASAAGKDPFAPTPKDQMCTQIYGGPQTATVTGTWNGKKVDSAFNRTNGCETKRWDDLKPLFGPLPTVR